MGTGRIWCQPSGRRVAIPANPAEGLPNSRRLRAGQLDSLKQSCLNALYQQLFQPGGMGANLWELNLVSRLLNDPAIGARSSGLLAVIETPEAMEAYLLRSQGQDDLKRRARRCIQATEEALRLAGERGWLQP